MKILKHEQLADEMIVLGNINECLKLIILIASTIDVPVGYWNVNLFLHRFCVTFLSQCDFFVVVGSAADVCDLQMKDIILSVNRKDVSTMTLPQVQHMVDNAAKQGHVELKVKREAAEGETQQSMITKKLDILHTEIP